MNNSSIIFSIICCNYIYRIKPNKLFKFINKLKESETINIKFQYFKILEFFISEMAKIIPIGTRIKYPLNQRISIKVKLTNDTIKHTNINIKNGSLL
jgi:hypothetical protein